MSPRPRSRRGPPRGETPRVLRVFASAKVNLGWRVGEPRPDGFHDVQGVLQTISVHDRLEVRIGEAEGACFADGLPVALTVSGAEDPGALHTPDNLVLRAAARLAEEAEPVPTSLALRKEIPVAAGLGGGSADAAAALMGLSFAWRIDLTAADLVRIAADVGSDVPAIVLGGLVAAGGRGEDVRAIGHTSGYSFVVGVPDARLSTPEVYRRLDELRGAGPITPGDGFASNDLEAAAVSLAPVVGEGLEAMRRAGASPVFVSGSGPSVVGVLADPSRADAVVAAAAPAFRWIRACTPVPWGVRLAFGAPP